MRLWGVERCHTLSQRRHRGRMRIVGPAAAPAAPRPASWLVGQPQGQRGLLCALPLDKG